MEKFSQPPSPIAALWPAITAAHTKKWSWKLNFVCHGQQRNLLAGLCKIPCSICFIDQSSLKRAKIFLN